MIIPRADGEMADLPAGRQVRMLSNERSEIYGRTYERKRIERGSHMSMFRIEYN